MFLVSYEIPRKSINGCKMKEIAESPENKREICFAQAGGGFDEGVKDCLQIKRRPTDNLQHVGHGPLLFERLVPLASEPRDLRFVAGSE